MQIKKYYFSKDPEQQEDIGEFFDFISGGSTPVDDKEEVEEPQEEIIEDTAGDPRDGEFVESDGEEDLEDKEPSAEESPEIDPRDEMIAKLEEQNRKLMEMMQNVTTPKKEEPKKEKEPDLFAGDSFKKLTEAFEFNEGESQLLANFMQQYGAQVAKKAVNDAMERTPGIVNERMTEAQAAQDLKRNFYETHPALKPVQGYVAQIANAVAQENPSLSVNQVLEETAIRTYSALNIDPKSISNGKEKPGRGKKPAFANTSKGGRKVKPKKSAFDNEIDAMLATLN